MSMTRKHFEAVARAMKATRDNTCKDHIHSLASQTLACQALADEFEQINPAFNRYRFLEACGVND